MSDYQQINEIAAAIENTYSAGVLWSSTRTTINPDGAPTSFELYDFDDYNVETLRAVVRQEDPEGGVEISISDRTYQYCVAYEMRFGIGAPTTVVVAALVGALTSEAVGR